MLEILQIFYQTNMFNFKYTKKKKNSSCPNKEQASIEVNHEHI